MNAAASHRVPRVSLGLPVYNGERFVADAIQSALSQTLSDFELVISDNASTDGTDSICRHFAKVDPRVRYSRSSTNRGAAPNFNRCFALSQPTEFFKWIAHDDLMTEDFLERCIRALDDDPSVALAFPAMVYADADGNLMSRQIQEDLSLISDDPGRRAQLLIRYGLEAPDIYWTVYGVMRRHAIEQTALHGSYIASDQVFLFELAAAGKFVQVPDALFIRRIHAEAWTMRADRTPESDAAWFDAGLRSHFLLPHWTLLYRHFLSIWHSDVSLGAKARCARAVGDRTIREWRELGGDMKRAMRDLARRYLVPTAMKRRKR